MDKTEKKKKRRDDDDLKDLAANSSTRGPVLPTTNGHINLFEDLEQVDSFFCDLKGESTHFLNDQSSLMAAIKATKKVLPAETEKGVPLAPLAKDLKPWYSERTPEQPAEEQDEKRCVSIHSTADQFIDSQIIHIQKTRRIPKICP